MVGTQEVLRQFHRLGVKPSVWARAEITELGNILVPGEHLKHVVFGWYENGFALLCCTEHRVLLIDKKPFFFKLEDLRYDKISEVRYLNRLLDSTLVLSYAGMKLDFKSWKQRELRKLMEFIQETIMKINQQQWSQEYQSVPLSIEQQVPDKVVPPVASTPQVDGLSYELLAYPDDLMQRARADLGLQRNPYAPTTKFLRRRTPALGFNQTSR